MLNVLLLSAGVDEDVIKVYNTTCVKKAAEGSVYVRLKSCQCIGKAKWHDLVFKMSISCVEGCFPFITHVDSDVVVCIAQVKLSKDFGT
ncbi:uncharacterized protein ASPGLDRAFT_138887 [Aspergillus glaucus CBS 516.65]|uniref:Uncharacterized protein n=1 Tax=Aspergillus glaucus CBS 516.65 TaxID=1160497 RepID=A0A1L9V3I2_ASPGL|nr:hypothetical protein ASPGLDRAFT_138887 [Aspergillus glaucus CBS 516.65]OJJ78451.1 hypothetical protein ASPGLDRAFT_138887 [Aspergillus glaucus CBS 516.65]